MVRAEKASEVKGKRNTKSGVRINNTKVCSKRICLNARQIFFIALMLFFLMGSGIGYVWSNFEGTQIGYDLSLLQQKERDLKELNQKLKVELATLKSPQNLEAAARPLGLKQPLQEQVIILP